MQPILTMAVVALLFALAAPAPAGAAPDDVLLARIVTNESSWLTDSGSNENEAALIHLVLADRAERRGWTLREAMQRYSPRACGVWREHRTPRSRWVSTLDAHLREPASWPDGLDWTDFRPRWEARLAEARAVLSDPPKWRDICDIPANHWGGAMDMENPLRFGWVRADCGPTHNIAWCAPGLSPECRELRGLERDRPRALGARSGPIPRG